MSLHPTDTLFVFAPQPRTNGEKVDEELRILRAIRDGRMCFNDAGRWVIDGEPRPNRKRREALVKGGFIAHRRGREYTLLERGVRMLELHPEEDS